MDLLKPETLAYTETVGLSAQTTRQLIFGLMGKLSAISRDMKV